MLMTLALWLLPTTWIVDAAAGPGTNFIDLPAAIAAAAPGDTILVLPGNYSAIAVTNKGVSIRGAGTGLTFVNGTFFVSATPAGSMDLVSGLTVQGTVRAHTGALLSLMDIDVVAPAGGHALDTSACQVFALRCRFRGGDLVGAFPSQPGVVRQGGHGAAIGFTRFAAAGCEFRGGAYFNTGGTALGYGGAGAWMDNSTAARLDGCTLRGGNASAGTGGNGVFARSYTRVDVEGAAADVVASGTGQIVFGWYGAAIGIDTNNPASQVVVHGPVTVTGTTWGPVTAGSARPRLAVTASTTASGETDSAQPVTVSFDGMTPSAAFLFLLAFRPSFSPLQAPFDGDLLVDLSTTAIVSGPLDATGNVQFMFVPLAIFGGPLPFPLYMQFAVLDPNGDVRLSHLDARFYSL